MPIGSPAPPPDVLTEDWSDRPVFAVHLENFDGPFDLLLSLIAKHKLDVTDVALSQVSDEFIAYITAERSWELGQATEFLVVAATLLDLKAARLLPTGDDPDEEDLALLEARDLLFARLLQYRAYKSIAGSLREWEQQAARRFPRAVSLEPRYAEALPEVLLGVGPEQFARIAARAFVLRAPPVVDLGHLTVPRISVREQADLLRDRLAAIGVSTFADLVADCVHTAEVIARFLAVLELYRESALAVEQDSPLGDLVVRWTGSAGEPGAAGDVDEEYE
ncbi:MAG: segregation and condensation protein A [Mycobacteriales bacterium]